MVAVICRILLLSETKMFPSLSTAILVGLESLAVVAAIPLTVSSKPPPATVVIMPVLDVTFLIDRRFAEVTKMYMFPAVSNAMLVVEEKKALVARMPFSSPAGCCPPPATVVIMPVLIAIFLILPLALSAI